MLIDAKTLSIIFTNLPLNVHFSYLVGLTLIKVSNFLGVGMGCDDDTVSSKITTRCRYLSVAGI